MWRHTPPQDHKSRLESESMPTSLWYANSLCSSPYFVPLMQILAIEICIGQNFEGEFID